MELHSRKSLFVPGPQRVWLQMPNYIQSQVGFEPFKSEIWMKGPKKKLEYNEDQRESNGKLFSICVQQMWNSRELKKTAIKRAGEASSN